MCRVVSNLCLCGADLIILPRIGLCWQYFKFCNLKACFSSNAVIFASPANSGESSSMAIGNLPYGLVGRVDEAVIEVGCALKQFS